MCSRNVDTGERNRCRYDWNGTEFQFELPVKTIEGWSDDGNVLFIYSLCSEST